MEPNTMSLHCRDCNSDFDFPPRDQEFFEAQGWNLPIRCRPCRQARKEQQAQREQQREPSNNPYMPDPVENSRYSQIEREGRGRSRKRGGW